MSRTLVIVFLSAGLAVLLLSFRYYYREMRQAYRDDMEARHKKAPERRI